MTSSQLPTTSKPPELIAIREACAILFGLLQHWFEVPDRVELDVSSVSGPEVTRQLRDGQFVAALAMRKLQALSHTAEPGVLTAVDVVITLVDGALRPLLEAPTSYMARRAAACDWDEEFRALGNGLVWRDPQRTDEEIATCRRSTETLVRLRERLVEMAAEGCHLLA